MKAMLVLALVALVGVVYCGKPGAPCPCPFIYFPVCGKDGNTYDNDCVAKCANTPVDYQGICQPTTPKRCKCPRSYIPVCGVDGNTYANACLLRCAKVRQASDGPCPITAV